MQIRDRVKELRRVKASELRPNPRNWRLHPPSQRNVLCGVLAEIGYANALVARELEDGSLELIDGHLRAESTPDQMVPVLVLDVSEEESQKLLLTLDPLSALAERDAEQLESLLAEVQFNHPAVRQMLADLANLPATAKDNDDRPDVAVTDSYQVAVECATESEQRAVFNRLTREGYRCRVLTL